MHLFSNNMPTCNCTFRRIQAVGAGACRQLGTGSLPRAPSLSRPASQPRCVAAHRHDTAPCWGPAAVVQMDGARAVCLLAVWATRERILLTPCASTYASANGRPSASVSGWASAQPHTSANQRLTPPVSASVPSNQKAADGRLSTDPALVQTAPKYGAVTPPLAKCLR
jgi:hypothetical protein